MRMAAAAAPTAPNSAATLHPLHRRRGMMISVVVVDVPLVAIVVDVNRSCRHVGRCVGRDDATMP